MTKLYTWHLTVTLSRVVDVPCCIETIYTTDGEREGDKNREGCEEISTVVSKTPRSNISLTSISPHILARSRLIEQG